MSSPLDIDPPAFRLFQPDRDQAGAHRILCPRGAQGDDPDLQAYAERMAQQFREIVVPEAERRHFRETTTLRKFFTGWMLPERERRILAGQLAKGSLSKDFQSLNRWERFTRPPEWPLEKPWEGLPIGYVTPGYAESFLDRMKAAPGMAKATVKSTWSHLRTMFNYAVQVRALERKLDVEAVKLDDDLTLIYTADQVQHVYNALAECTPLQVAFVIGCNVGPRTLDLFTLRWEGVQLDGPRPLVHFTSRKTGKLQGIPLAPVTVEHIRRLQKFQLFDCGMLFPGMSSPTAKDPERAHVSRARNRRMKVALRSVGITYAKPFQVCRATCNERLESHKQGAGQFVLGHALALNSRSYRQPDEMVWEAVSSLPQPDCFFRF